MKKNNNKKGFTIVELVIVIAVIAILAAVLIPTFSNVIKSAQDSATVQEANAIYKNYVASVDYADGKTPAKNLVIEVKAATGSNSDGKYVIVVNAQLQDTVYTTVGDAAKAAVGAGQEYTLIEYSDATTETVTESTATAPAAG